MRKKELTLYFGLTFVWIWAVAGFVLGLPDVAEATFGPMSGTNPLFILAVWGPNIVALMLSAAWYGGVGVLGLLRRIVIWKVHVKWYAFALVGIPALGLAASVLGGTLSESPIGSGVPGLWTRLGPILLNLLITGPLGEELGWRGYALPRLLRRRNPLTGSLILGSLWGLWHLPSFLAAGTPNSGTSLPAFLLGAISLSIIATWLLLHTRESVLLAALLHLGANFALTAIGAPLMYFSPALLFVCVVLVAAKPGFWFGPTYLTETVAGPAAEARLAD